MISDLDSIEEQNKWSAYTELYEVVSVVNPKHSIFWTQSFKVKNKQNNEIFLAKIFLFSDEQDLRNFVPYIKDIMRAKHNNLIDTHEFYIDRNNSSNVFKVAFIQEYLERQLILEYNAHVESENSLFFSSTETKKLIFQAFSLMEYIQKSRLHLKYISPNSFYVTEFENFKLSGLIATYIHLSNPIKFPLSKDAKPSQSPNQKQEKSIQDLDPLLKGVVKSNTYKDDALKLCIRLLDALSLGKCQTELSTDSGRRSLIDRIKAVTKIELVQMLHYISSDSSHLRSDFLMLKKIRDNPTNKKSKEFKFDRIIAEEEGNYDEDKAGAKKTQKGAAESISSRDNEVPGLLVISPVNIYRWLKMRNIWTRRWVY